MRLPRVRATDTKRVHPVRGGDPDSTSFAELNSGYDPDAATSTGVHGIADLPELSPPDLNSASTRQVKFNTSSPQGYYFPQVEAFVEQTAVTLAFWEDREFKARQVINALHNELSLQVHDVQRLRTEIELFTVQGTPLVNADGSYLTESQTTLPGSGDTSDGKIEQLAELLADAEGRAGAASAALKDLTAQSDEMEQTVTHLTRQVEDLTAELAAQTVAATEWSDAAYTETDILQRELARLQQDNEALAHDLRAALDDARDDVAVVPVPGAHGVGPDQLRLQVHHKQPLRLPTGNSVDTSHEGEQFEEAAEAVQEARINAPVLDERRVGDGPGDGFLDALAAQHPDEGPTNRPLPVMPVDTELPPGSVLPARTNPAAMYPPSQPGSPLTRVSGPIFSWAPELDDEAHEASDANDGGGSPTVSSVAPSDDPDSVPVPRLWDRAAPRR